MRLAGGVLSVALVAAASVWALEAWVVKPNRCNAAITRLTGASILAERKRDSIDGQMLAKKNLLALRSLEPDCALETNLFMLIALNEQIAGDRLAGIASYDRALQIDQRPEIHVAKAALLVEEQRIDEAVAAYAMAVKMAPISIRHVPEALQEDVAHASGVPAFERHWDRMDER